jgi:hypothetical protein
MDSVLRPRDIQARIRAGETPEDVAAAAQTSVDRIMGFATPVLAERAYQAELARKASVRRRTATGPVGHLGQAVEAYLEPHGLGVDDVEWDAWRREDGRWTVLATYLSGAAQQTARFTFDTGGRFVVADNDEARALVGERTAEEPAAVAPVADADPDDAAREDSAVGSDTDSGTTTADADQLALGDDTLGMVLGRPADEAPAGPSADESALSSEPESGPPSGPELTEDLTPVTRAVRSVPPAGTGDADWMVTQASDRPAPAAPAAPAAAAAPVDPVAVEPAEPAAQDAPDEDPFEEALFAAPVPEPRDEPAPETAAAADPAEAAEAAGPAPEAEAEPRKQPAKSARGRGRASVPSWDEIMFGTPKDP